MGGVTFNFKKFLDCFFSRNFIDVSYDNWWYTIVFVLILWSFCRIQNLNIRNSTKVVPRCIWWYHILAAFKKKIKILKLLKLQWHTAHLPANHTPQILCKSKTSQRKLSVGQLKYCKSLEAGKPTLKLKWHKAHSPKFKTFKTQVTQGTLSR